METSGSSYLLIVENISKSFKNKKAVDGLSLRLRRGEVYALLGPNGAGKTTALRIIVGIYKPDKGIVKICGYEPKQARLKRCLAYLPEDVNVYERLSGFEHLRLLLSLYVGEGDEIEKLFWRAVEYSSLSISDLKRRTGEYSKGMRRRLLLSSLLALEPPLLVLDEPTSGLDVHSAVMMRRLIRSIASRGKAVLMTSHNMLEVERVADRVGFMYSGRLVDEGTPRELAEKYSARDLEEAYVKAVELSEEFRS